MSGLWQTLGYDEQPNNPGIAKISKSKNWQNDSIKSWPFKRKQNGQGEPSRVEKLAPLGR